LRLEMQPNSLSDLVSDTIESFAELAARQGVRLVGRAEPDVDPVSMDAQLIGRVLSNLVSNALRHTSSGGTVHVQAVRHDDRVRVEVQDSGEGIDPQDLPPGKLA